MREPLKVAMIERTRLVDLLAWTDAGYVETSEDDLRARAWIPGVGVVDVHDEMEALLAAHLVVEPVQSLRWVLTPAGREVLDRGGPGA